MQKARTNNTTSHRQTLRYSPRLQDMTTTFRCASHRQKSPSSPKPYLKRRRVSKRNMFCFFDFHKDQIQCSTRPTQVCCITRITKRPQVAEAAAAHCSLKTGFTIDMQRNLISTRLKLSRRSTTTTRSLKEALRLRGSPSKRIPNLRSIKKATKKASFGKGKLKPRTVKFNCITSIFFMQPLRHCGGNIFGCGGAAVSLRLPLARRRCLLEPSLPVQSVSSATPSYKFHFETQISFER